jgi:radical SAM superfamily enzyme YgiQ (UPF0313 family)
LVFCRSTNNAALLFYDSVALQVSLLVPSPGAQSGIRDINHALELAALMKTLGLIAMSGVRVVNPELINLGLTLPGFVERGKVIASLPTLGLLTLAGLTPESWEVSYHNVCDINKLEKLPGPFDIAAISSLAAQIEEAYELADKYRAEGCHVIMGGLHVSAVPEEALQHADAIVIGEAEPVWRQVLADWEVGKLQRVYRNRAAQFDLAAGTETFEAVWKFIQEVELFEVQLTVLAPFPGTPLYERLQKEGRLLNVGQWNRCTLFDVNFRPDRMSVEALETGLRDLMSKVYNKEFTAWRRDQFFRRLRRNRRLRRGLRR